MLQSLRNIWDIPDLRKRVLFTLGLLAVYRLGSHIPTPGHQRRGPDRLLRAEPGATGSAWWTCSRAATWRRSPIFALGIMPYISASIILQLLTVVWPYLEKLSKEGELGRRKITQYTRYGTVLLSHRAVARHRRLPGAHDARPAASASSRTPASAFKLMTVLTLTTGTAFIMWLGEQITERGIGNGMSLLIFAGIVVGFPARPDRHRRSASSRGDLSLIAAAPPGGDDGAGGGGHRVRGARPAPHHGAVRQARGGPPHVRRPVHPPAAAREHQRRHPRDLRLLDHRLPADDRLLLPGQQPLDADGRPSSSSGAMPLYNLLYVAFIIFFCYFYTVIVFNPDDVAENMRKYGGFIPGIRPGKRTAEYLDHILGRITFGGAIYLALIALLPEFLITGFKVAPIPVIGPPLDIFLSDNSLGWITEGLGLNFYFGGTSLLIVVGVAMDTVAQVEAQLIMRHYEGFTGPGGPEDPWPALSRSRASTPRARHLPGPSGRGQGHAGRAAGRAPGRARASRPATCCARPSRAGTPLGRRRGR